MEAIHVLPRSVFRRHHGVWNDTSLRVEAHKHSALGVCAGVGYHARTPRHLGNHLGDGGERVRDHPVSSVAIAGEGCLASPAIAPGLVLISEILWYNK